MGVTTPIPNPKIPRDLAPYHGRGRPSKLTPERHLKIVEQVRKGVPVEVAAGASGVSRAVFFNWMERGEKDKAEEVSSIYVDFLDSVLKARDELEGELAAKWRKISTEGTEKVKRVYKEQVIVKEDGSHEIVRYLDSETIDVTGDGDWRGISEFMLRRFNERWNRKEGIEVSGPGGGPIEVNGNLVIDSLPLWLKQCLVITSSGKTVSPELEEMILREVGEKFLEVEYEVESNRQGQKLIGKGDTSHDVSGRRDDVEVSGMEVDSDQARMRGVGGFRFVKGDAGDWEGRNVDEYLEDGRRGRGREKLVDVSEL